MTTPRSLSNRYELGDTLGYGGMSEVHHGRDIRLGREVAVKVLRADLARDPQFQERFRREAQNAAALNHPAIVAVYDTGETRTEYGPLPYIVMEYVDGRTLRDIVKTEGPLPGQRAMEIMADVCAALDFSHRHGIIHRDVKPANVMITKTGAVKVMDFGIARAIHDGQAAVTQTAAVIGTAQYLSPEQARGEAVDARSDVYATGCVLFELLTGEPPFTGDSPVAVAYQHVREQPRPPSALNPRVSPQLDAIVLKAMAKSAASRYQSAAEMRMDLVRVLSGQRPIAPMAAGAAEARTQVMGAGSGQAGATRTRPRPEAAARDYDETPPPDDVDEERQRRRRRNLIITLVAVAVVGLVVLMFWLMGNGSGGNQQADTVTIPTSLKGMQENEARKTLRDLGFTKTPGQRVPCEAPAPGQDPPCTPDDYGKVIKTNPELGTAVPKTQTVTLLIASPPGQVTVPDLTGLSVPDAIKRLQEVGLELSQDQSQEETEDDTLVNKIVGQNPSAETPVTKGTQVKITLGKAPTSVNVPNVIGQTFSAAQTNLKSQGFQVARQDVDSDQAKDTVVDQAPKNTKVKPGSIITLKVSKGQTTPTQITVPNLQGKTVQEATSLLRGMGWTGSINVVDEQPTSDASQDGKIRQQSPGPGDTIDPNEDIDVQTFKKRGGGITIPTGPTGFSAG